MSQLRAVHGTDSSEGSLHTNSRLARGRAEILCAALVGSRKCGVPAVYPKARMVRSATADM